MKLKIKKGEELVSSFYHSDRHGDDLIINLNDRWGYKDFNQWKNHLYITTEQGVIDFVFSSDVPVLKFSHEEKEQILFNVDKQ